MKNQLLLFFLFFSLLLHAQVPDTATVRVEVDSLIALNCSLIDDGKYHDALEVIQSAEEPCLKAFGEQTALYAKVGFNIGRTYHYQQDFSKVESFYLKAKSIQEQTIGANHPDYTWTLNALGRFYFNLGQYTRSESYYLESKDIQERTLGKDHFSYANTLQNLVNLYSRIGIIEKAKPFYLQSKKIIEKTLDIDHPSYAKTLRYMGNWHLKMGEYEKAESYYLQSKNVLEKTLGKAHPSYANTLHRLGLLYSTLGLYEKVESFFLESINILEKTFGKAHPSQFMTLYHLGIFYTKTGNYNKAGTRLLESISVQKKSLINAARHLSHHELFLFVHNNINHQFIFKSLAQNHPKWVAVAYDNSLFFKGFLLNTLQEMNRLARSNETSMAQYQQLQPYYRQLAVSYSMPLNKEKNFAELEERVVQLERELARMVASFGNAIRQTDYKEVQAQLFPKEVAIEFIYYRYHNPEDKDSVMYSALILKPDEKEPKLIPLFEEKSLKALLQQSQINRADFIKNLYSTNVKSESLFNLIFQPLEKELEGIETIYYSPTILLHLLNLGAIQLNENETFGDRFNLIQVNNTMELAISDSTEFQDQTATLFGGIEYDYDSLALLQANTSLAFENANTTNLRSENINNTDTILQGEDWNYLKWTAVEVQANEHILKAANFETTLKKGLDATEKAFKEMATKENAPRILHFATHGFFYPNPRYLSNKSDHVFKMSELPMIRSGLLLAGANRAWAGKPPLKNMEDGILTAYEISQMDLSNTELVVLSACETGLGDIGGNEGVYGLQRAFKIAGAKHLIMSFWQVPDFQTQDLMTAFYTYWLKDKLSIRAALKAAQNKVREKYPNPFYWAGFVLVE